MYCFAFFLSNWDYQILLCTVSMQKKISPLLGIKILNMQSSPDTETLSSYSNSASKHCVCVNSHPTFCRQVWADRTCYSKWFALGLGLGSRLGLESRLEFGFRLLRPTLLDVSQSFSCSKPLSSIACLNPQYNHLDFRADPYVSITHRHHLRYSKIKRKNTCTSVEFGRNICLCASCPACVLKAPTLFAR